MKYTFIHQDRTNDTYFCLNCGSSLEPQSTSCPSCEKEIISGMSKEEHYSSQWEAEDKIIFFVNIHKWYRTKKREPERGKKGVFYNKTKISVSYHIKTGNFFIRYPVTLNQKTKGKKIRSRNVTKYHIRCNLLSELLAHKLEKFSLDIKRFTNKCLEKRFAFVHGGKRWDSRNYDKQIYNISDEILAVRRCFSVLAFPLLINFQDFPSWFVIKCMDKKKKKVLKSFDPGPNPGIVSFDNYTNFSSFISTFIQDKIEEKYGKEYKEIRNSSIAIREEPTDLNNFFIQYGYKRFDVFNNLDDFLYIFKWFNEHKILFPISQNLLELFIGYNLEYCYRILLRYFSHVPDIKRCGQIYMKRIGVVCGIIYKKMFLVHRQPGNGFRNNREMPRFEGKKLRMKVFDEGHIWDMQRKVPEKNLVLTSSMILSSFRVQIKCNMFLNVE